MLCVDKLNHLYGSMLDSHLHEILDGGFLTSTQPPGFKIHTQLPTKISLS